MTTAVDDLHNHLGPVYVEIDQDVTRVHAYWKLIAQLFGSQESVDILNRAAGFAIRAMQDALTDSIILRITKLTDPASSQGGRFQNLSLENLINNLPSDADASLIDALRTQLQHIQSATENFRLVRHKRLAHRDTAYAIDSTQALPGVPRQSIEDSFELIRNFMHEIQGFYGFERTAYPLVELGRDGDHLLFHLLCGDKFLDLHENAQLGKLTDAEIIRKIKELPKREARSV
jgi:hypothetical protein